MQSLFWGDPFSEQSLICSSHFFQNTYFLRIGGSLGQVLFEKLTFLAEKLFRINKFSVELLFRTRYFRAALTFAEELLFQKANFRKSNIPHCLLFQNSYFLIVATFLKELTFLKDFTFHSNYFFQKSYFFRRDTISQLRFFFTATLPIYQLVVKWARYQSGTVKVWEFFLVYLLLLKVAS